MSTHLIRKITLALLLFPLALSTVHASGVTLRSTLAQTRATPDSVTGGDPEPTTPSIVQTILAILYLA